MYVWWMYACDYCFYSCFSRDSEPAVTALASKYCKLLPYEVEVLFVCMYVCMYVVNMCTLYDITNVWNKLGCLLRLQPTLPLRRRHQHPDVPWWVLHPLVCWVCMLVTYILVCNYDVNRCMFSFWNICYQLSCWSAGEDANRCEVERPQCSK